MNYRELITAYETDVQFADVSGMEHLDMLMTRSEIAQNELHLSDEERKRVLKADRQLLQRAKQFYKSIRSIADLASWRRDENIPVTQWWCCPLLVFNSSESRSLSATTTAIQVRQVSFFNPRCL